MMTDVTKMESLLEECERLSKEVQLVGEDEKLINSLDLLHPGGAFFKI